MIGRSAMGKNSIKSDGKDRMASLCAVCSGYKYRIVLRLTSFNFHLTTKKNQSF